MRRAIGVAVLAAAVAMSGTVSRAENSGANSIKVEVSGLHSSDGVVNCALFGPADGFPDDSSKAVKTLKTGIENGKAVCAFPDVGAGDYGVAAYHDENSNGKLDRNFIGMPKEGVGTPRMMRPDISARRNSRTLASPIQAEPSS